MECGRNGSPAKTTSNEPSASQGSCSGGHGFGCDRRIVYAVLELAPQHTYEVHEIVLVDERARNHHTPQSACSFRD